MSGGSRSGNGRGRPGGDGGTRRCGEGEGRGHCLLQLRDDHDLQPCAGTGSRHACGRQRVRADHAGTCHHRLVHRHADFGFGPGLGYQCKGIHLQDQGGVLPWDPLRGRLPLLRHRATAHQAHHRRLDRSHRSPQAHQRGSGNRQPRQRSRGEPGLFLLRERHGFFRRRCRVGPVLRRAVHECIAGLPGRHRDGAGADRRRQPEFDLTREIRGRPGGPRARRAATRRDTSTAISDHDTLGARTLRPGAPPRRTRRRA